METVDGMSLGKINGIIDQLRSERIDGPPCVGFTSRKRMKNEPARHTDLVG